MDDVWEMHKTYADMSNCAQCASAYKVDIECAVRKDIWVTTRYGDEDNGDGDDCDGDEGVEDAGAGDDAGDGMVSFILEAALNSYMYTRGTHLRPSSIDSPSD